MILLSDKEIDYQIDYILNHNDLSLNVLLIPLMKSAAKAQVKKIIAWGEEPCSHYDSSKRRCSGCWQQLKQEVEE